MGIRLLLGDDHAYAIVVTATSRKKFVLPANSADIRAKALEALRALGSPSSDPRPQLNQLYAMIVAPLEGRTEDPRISTRRERQRPHAALVARRRFALRAHGRALRRQPLHGRALSQRPLHSRKLRPHDRFPASERRLHPARWPWACRRATAACLRFPASFPSSIPSSTIPQFPIRTAPCRANCCPTSNSRWPHLKSELGVRQELLCRAHRQPLRPHRRQRRRAFPA